MTVEIEPNGEVSEEAMADLEEQIGHPLPPDYRAWLTANNGGYIRVGAALPSVPMYLNVLTQAVDDSGESDLMFERETSEYLTDDYLGINEVDSGLLAVKLVDPDRGSVWYLDDDDMGLEYDYEQAGYDSEPAYICAEKLQRVADSFDDLIARLVPVADEVARNLSRGPDPGSE
ncbi:MAG: SMI1/KNR4 family protein [Micromonosporaceae bacterium]